MTENRKLARAISQIALGETYNEKALKAAKAHPALNQQDIAVLDRKLQGEDDKSGALGFSLQDISIRIDNFGKPSDYVYQGHPDQIPPIKELS